jgi:hypothetical protein
MGGRGSPGIRETHYKGMRLTRPGRGQNTAGAWKLIDRVGRWIDICILQQYTWA